MFEVAGININPVDLAFVIVMVISLIIGLIKGFVWAAKWIVILVGGLFAANHFQRGLSPILRNISSKIEPPFDAYLSYFLIFIAVVVVVSLIAYLLRKALKKLKLRTYDRLLGGVVGLIVGAVVLITVMALGISFLPNEDFLQKPLGESYSLKIACEGIRRITVLFPEQMRDEVIKIREILESTRVDSQEQSASLQEKGKLIMTGGDRPA